MNDIKERRQALASEILHLWRCDTEACAEWSQGYIQGILTFTDDTKTLNQVAELIDKRDEKWRVRNE